MDELPPQDARLTKRVPVYITEDEYNRLTVLCQQKGYSVSELGRGLFRMALLGQEGNDKV